MENFVLVLVTAGAFLFGFYIAYRVDRYLERKSLPRSRSGGAKPRRLWYDRGKEKGA